MAQHAARTFTGSRSKGVTIAAVVAMAVGAAVLLGWLADIEALRTFVPGTNPMVASTAVCFILTGAALWLLRQEGGGPRRRWAGMAAGLGAATIGLLKLAEYAFGWDLGIDQTLFTRNAGPFPGQMAIPTAITFVVLGTAVATLDLETRGGGRPAQNLARLALLLPVLGLVGRLYGVPTLSRLVGGTVVMALHTSATFLVLAVGVLLARPDRGSMRITNSEGPAGYLLRRLLPLAILLVILAGWLRVVGQRAGLYGTELGTALMVMLTLTMLYVLIWVSARSLHRADLERRQAEAALRSARAEAERAREMAETANRAKSEFLSRMSHELRTPLNAVLGFGQLLEMDELTDEQRQSVRQILKGGQHLLDLINEVLDISRIESGRLSISVEPVSLHESIRESLDLVGPLADAAGISFEADEDTFRSRYVMADRQRLKQVLLNLLSNSVKYNREGGRVLLTCREPSNGRVRLEVSDTGPGIPEELQGLLFRPFERLGADGTSVEGTGLGLALAHGLVEAMGGEMGVQSSEGHGSTFWVELSVAQTQTASLDGDGEVPDDDRGAVPGRSQTVLYIEDNAANLRLVERALSRRPMVKMISAMQGRLGVELARQHRPDLVLLDLHLPDLSGDDVLRRLRLDRATREIPVVMVSADATPGRVKQLLEAGAKSYLTKPLDISRLLALIDEVGNGTDGAG